MQEGAIQIGIIGSIAIGCVASINSAIAQVVPDHTLPVNSSVTPGCTICTIEGGTVRGSNLFHSFKEFSVPTGGEAFFNNASQIETIFSRVTGNSISNIDGLLRTNGTANLFFLNPNGVIFGQNARLEIGGSFFVSTASSFKFPDGSEFSAINPEAPPLLAINVTPGLQYGENQPGATITNRGNLAVGQDLTLSAGNLDLQGQIVTGRDLTLQAADTIKVRDSSTNPFIASSGGKLLVEGNQGVDIFALNHPNSGLFSGGDMALRSANTVGGDAHYWSGGSFRIEKLDGDLGDLYSPYDPIIRTLGDVNFDAYLGTSLHILAGGEVNIDTVIITDIKTGAASPDYLQETVPLSNGGEISINGSLQPTLDIRAGVAPAFIGVPGVTGFNPATDVFLGQGFPTNVPTSANISIGDIWIVPPNGLVFITNQYQPNAALPGGDITVTGAGVFSFGIDARGFGGNGSSVILDSRGNIAITDSSIDSSSDSGNGGNIALISKANVSLEGASIKVLGAGGGSIAIKAQNLNLFGGSNLQAGIAQGLGDVNTQAGDITISVAESLTMAGLKRSFIENDVNTEAVGNGGDINIQAESIFLKDAAFLSTEISGQGNAGDITIVARNTVSFEGIGDTLFNTLALSRVNEEAVGKGGNITITTGSLFLTNRAQLTTSTQGLGDSGSIFIQAQELVSFSNSSVFTEVSDLGGVGNGGDINITTGSLLLTDGADLRADTENVGDAGDIKIVAHDNVTFSAEGQFIGGAFSTVEGGAVGNGGDVSIITETFSITGVNRIDTSTENQGNAGKVFIDARDSITLIGSDAVILSSVSSDGIGDGGDININTGALSVTEGASLSTATFGQGDAGDLIIQARDTVFVDGARGIDAGNSGDNNLGVTVEDQAVGNGGDLFIETGSLFASNGARLSASTEARGNSGDIIIRVRDTAYFDQSFALSTVDATGLGSGGNIDIQTGTLFVTNGSRLVTATEGSGNAGNVIIRAQDLVSFDGEGSNNSDRLTSGAFSNVRSEAIGNGGNIDIQTGLFSLTNGAEVNASTSGVGDAGNIFLRNADSVFLDNSSISTQVNEGAVTEQPSNIDIQTRSLLLTNGSEVTASTLGQGDAGSIFVREREAEKVSLFNSSISTASISTGIAGDVTINTQQLTLQDNSQIAASTVSSLGGDITLQGLDNLQVKDSLISASTETGIAGAVSVFATNLVQLRGTGGLSVEATAGGTAGDLFVDTNEMSVTDGAQVTVSSPQGQAGNLSITANSLTLNQGKLSAVTATSSPSPEDGANITLSDLEFLGMVNESLISASALGNANGGNVNIDSTFIVATPPTGLEGSDIIANAQQGNGGRVNITTQGLFGIEFRPQRTPDNDITVSSEFGIAGEFALNQPDIDPSRGLAELPSNLVDAESQIDRTCTSGGTATRSSFVVTGRGGIPPAPTDSLDSDAIVSQWVTLDSEEENINSPNLADNPTSTTPKQIVEAAGWVKAPDGQVILVAQTPTATPYSPWLTPPSCQGTQATAN